MAHEHADVAELVDALDSGSSNRKVVEVQVLSSALKNLVKKLTRFFVCHPGEGRDLLVALFTSFSTMNIPVDSFEDEFTQAFATATLKGSRVTLVGLRERDSEGNDGPMSAAAVLALVQESEDFLAEHLPWVRGVTQTDIAKRIRSWVFAEQYGQGGCWGIFENEGGVYNAASAKLAGFIMLEANVKNHSANLSYWLSKKYTGRGLATEALQLLSRFAFDVLHLNRLELSVSVYNEKSAALAIRSGFQEEGKSRDFERINGIFVDHRRFSRLARDVRYVYLSKR